VLTCQGEILETAGRNAQALALYDQAVKVATETGDDEMLADALFSRAYLLGLGGDYAAGMADLKRAQALYEQLGMPYHAVTTLNGIAILYNRMGDYAQARDIYIQALKAQRAAGLDREITVTLHNLGRAYERLQEWEAAREAFTSSLALARKLSYTRAEAYALRGLAAVADATGDLQGALQTLERASDLQRRTPDMRLRAQIQLVRGSVLARLGRYSESIAALEEAAEAFEDSDALAELAAAHSRLADVHAQLHNWRAAYQHQSQAKATSEKLLRNQLDQRFATLKVEFDTAAKEKENELLLRENQANERALAQGRRVRQLQGAVIALTAMLAFLLATLAVHQRRSTLRMRELAMTDELTGAPNRRCVLGRLEALLAREDTPSCAILIVDIDHFKSINDLHGHSAGDEVLRKVAGTLRAAVQEPAFFGRLGGEEFLIVLPEADLDRALAAAERFREHILSIDTSQWCVDREHITASIGVTLSVPGDTPSTMLSRADAALYTAKRSGRNCVRVNPSPDARHDAWPADVLPQSTGS